MSMKIWLIRRVNIFSFLASSLILFAGIGWVYSLLEFPNAVRVEEMALPAGILVALAGQLFFLAKELRDRDERRSRFYLESCVLGYEEAKDLLQDGNNSRRVWIAAARALVHAKELACQVTDKTHCRVLELYRLKYRGVFHTAIADRPASFYYGVHDEALSVDEAAAQSTVPEVIGGMSYSSFDRDLAESSIREIWEAAQWPEKYTDPLRDFSEEEQGSLLVLYPGLYEFLKHKAQWHSAGGKLYPRS